MPLLTADGYEVDRLRLRQITGDEQPAGILLRSPSSLLTAPDADGALLADILLPSVTTTWNSAIPTSMNDGALWAGRGANFEATAGFRLAAGPVSVIFAPHFTYAANDSVDFFQSEYYPEDLLPPYQALWYRDEVRIDLPLRQGTEPISRFHLGQSSLALGAGPVTIGVATENQWWGPGIRNAIVMSTNAPGFPHAFVRLTEPVATPLGTIDARWIAGQTESSEYFELPTEEEPTGERRTRKGGIGAAAITLQPFFDRGLTVGIARSVYGPVDEDTDARAFGHRVFTSWTPLSATTVGNRDDQILSLFGRWLIPAANAEVYAEWARRELPLSFRDLLIHPNHSQGYTLGLQWAGAVRMGLVRLQAEATNLEMNTSFRTGRTTSFYVSYAGEPGYTNAGKVIGASIGPGSSSQWFAADYLRTEWQAGVFAGRTRWDNDAMYRAPWALLWGVPYMAHDVSTLTGVRGGGDWAGLRVNMEMIRENRMNYLFQNWAVDWAGSAANAVDIVNYRFRFTISPRLGKAVIR